MPHRTNKQTNTQTTQCVSCLGWTRQIPYQDLPYYAYNFEQAEWASSRLHYSCIILSEFFVCVLRPLFLCVFLPHLHTCTYIAIFFQYTQNTWGLSQDMLGRIGAVTIDAVANIFCVDVFIFIFLVFLLFVFPFVAHLSGDLLCLAFIFEIWISIFFSFFPIFARQTEMFAFCGAFQAIRLWVLFSWPFWEGVVSHLWAW